MNPKKSLEKHVSQSYQSNTQRTQIAQCIIANRWENRKAEREKETIAKAITSITDQLFTQTKSRVDKQLAQQYTRRKKKKGEKRRKKEAYEALLSNDSTLGILVLLLIMSNIFDWMEYLVSKKSSSTVPEKSSYHIFCFMNFHESVKFMPRIFISN